MSKSLKVIILFFVIMSALTYLLKKLEIKNSSDDLNMTFTDFDQIISDKIPKINASDLADLIMKQNDHYFLYNLQNDTNKNYNIPSSEQLTLSEIKNFNLNVNNKIILYDLYEEKAIQAYYLLNIRGYFNVQILQGGYFTWQNTILNADTLKLSSFDIQKLKIRTSFFGGNINTNNSNQTLKPQVKKIGKKIKEHHGC
jgi:rhodanese-related sulfurtransferase